MSIPEGYYPLRERSWGASNQWVEGRGRRREHGLGRISMSVEGTNVWDYYRRETYLPHH